MSASDVPVYINCRDRVTHLRALVSWLEQAGHERIVLLDNDSSYPPLLEYLKATPHDVVCLGANHGSRAIWAAGLAPNEWFVYTDPDVIPHPACPLDVVAHLRAILERYPAWSKAGLGLHVDDVPPTLDPGIVRWERGPIIRGQRLDGEAYVSQVDTTFALYRPGASFAYQGLRTCAPYEARHMSWYVAKPDEEDRYYLDRARAGQFGSSWAQAYHQNQETP